MKHETKRTAGSNWGYIAQVKDIFGGGLHSIRSEFLHEKGGRNLTCTLSSSYYYLTIIQINKIEILIFYMHLINAYESISGTIYITKTYLVVVWLKNCLLYEYKYIYI